MRKTLQAYKGVFFDAGDTLITIPEAQTILVEYLAEHSVPISAEDAARFLQEAMDRFYIRKKRNPEALCSPDAERTFWMDVYRYVLERLGVEQHLTKEEIQECCRELYGLYLEPSRYLLFDDVKPALERLSKAGYRIGLVSNFASELRLILEDKGILSYFDPLVISAEAGVEKPNPAIFRMALEQSGLAAQDVLYVGDHEINDIWAPAQVGMDAVRIKRYPDQTGEGIEGLMQLFD